METKKVLSHKKVLGPGVLSSESGEDFVFELNGLKPRYTEGELIGELRRYSKIVRGRAFTIEEYRAWKERMCTPETMMRRLGSWPRALALIGVAAPKMGVYEAEDLIENLERVWRKLGRAPGVVTLERHGPMSAAPYCRVWGSLTRACREFVRWKRGEISREELLRGRVRARRRKIRPGVRWAVLERDGHRCRGCGRGAGRGVELEVDHIDPVCRGGGDEMENLRVLCGECNRGKGGFRTGGVTAPGWATRGKGRGMRSPAATAGGGAEGVT